MSPDDSGHERITDTNCEILMCFCFVGFFFIHSKQKKIATDCSAAHEAEYSTLQLEKYQTGHLVHGLIKCYTALALDSMANRSGLYITS